MQNYGFAKTIINKNNKLGLSSSIISGIKHLQKEKTPFDGLLILLADQPAIKAAYFHEMIELFLKEQKKIIASNYENGLGVPAIFPALFVKDLLKIKGDKGAKEFLQKNKNKTKELPFVGICTPTLKRRPFGKNKINGFKSSFFRN